MVATRGAILGATFLANIVTARALGVDGRGAYFLAFTTAAAVVQFGNLGLHSSTLFQLAREPSRRDKLVVNSVWVGLGFGSLLAAISCLFLPHLFSGMAAHSGLGVAAMALVPTQLTYMLATGLLVGEHRIALYNACELGHRLLALGGTFVLFALGIGRPAFFLVVTVIAQGLVTTLAIWHLRPRRLDLRFDKALFRNGLRYGLRAYLACLLPYFVLRGSVFMLERMQGVSAVGQLSISLQLFDLLVVVPTTVATVIFPMLVQAGDDRWPQTVRWLRAMSLFMAVGCGFVALLAEPAIALCFGAQFLPAAQLLRWLLPGAFCLGGIMICSQYLAAEGIPWALIAAWVGALALFATSAAALIPRFGGVGSAMALSTTYAVLLPVVLQLARARARRGRSPLRRPLSALDPSGDPR